MSSKNVLISIIIPALNEEDYIARLLGDLLKSSYEHIEIIVSDNGSSDDTQKIVEEFVLKDKRVKLVHATPKGVCVARNTGARHAKGKYFFFFDADMRIAPQLLKNSVEELETRELDAASYHFFPSSAAFLEKIFFKFYDWIFTIRQYSKPIACGAALIAKCSVHREINGFDESLTMIEDMDYVRRAAKVGKFRLLDQKVRFDMRRFKQFGMLKVTSQWWVAGIAYLAGIRRVKWKYFKPNEQGLVGSGMKRFAQAKEKVKKQVQKKVANASKKITTTSKTLTNKFR